MSRSRGSGGGGGSKKYEISVEYVERRLSYAVKLRGSMSAQTALERSFEMATEHYANITSIDKNRFVRLLKGELEDMTLAQWAEMCGPAGPVVLVTTQDDDGLIKQKRDLEKKNDDLRAEKESLLAKFKATDEVFKEEILHVTKSEKQAREEQKGARLASENRVNALKHESERIKASTCEENLAKVFARLGGMEQLLNEERAARIDQIGIMHRMLGDEQAARTREVGGLNRMVGDEQAARTREVGGLNRMLGDEEAARLREVGALHRMLGDEQAARMREVEGLRREVKELQDQVAEQRIIIDTQQAEITSLNTTLNALAVRVPPF